jgi:hypothetical protein
MQTMAKKKAAPRKKTSQKAASGAMIISKSRVKGIVRKCNVGSDFYGALEGAVRGLVNQAEQRALANRRKTLRAADV